MIIQGTAIKPVLFLIPEFIFAAHGLKLIEKEQSCKKVSYDQNYFKAQVPIRTKLWLHTCARCGVLVPCYKALSIYYDIKITRGSINITSISL